MADSKKYNGSTWEHSLRKLTTSTDTFTTLPADIYADGNNATVALKGNTVQSGTPTPDNPIMPEGTGERTGNLLNVQPFTIESDSASHNIVLWSGTLPTGTYTISLNQDDNLTSALRNTLRLIIGGTTYYESANENYHLQSGQHKMTFTISDSSQNVEIRYWGNTLSNECSYSNIMLNTGSTPLPYEPYGIKIPISNGQQTTNIYLGSTQTTRQIKKLVLDGTENWVENPTRFGYRFGLALSDCMQSDTIDEKSLCTHLSLTDRGGTGLDVQNVYVISADEYLIIKLSNSDRLSDLKSLLSQQYAAGTPVTVYYVLVTAETATVNEPLMRIGDYADEVSGITIPTITSKDTFDVDTTLKPSEVELTYTGWHDASVKEWDGSQWQ